MLNEEAANAWDAIRAVIKNVLCKNRSPHYRIFISNLMQALDAFDVHMSLKIHMLHAHFEFYEQQLSTETDEVGERFHQTIMVFEERYSGKRFDSMLADFCWKIASDQEDKE